MATIPTVPGSMQVNTPSAGVKLDFNTLNAPNVAAGNMAQAIGDVGRVVGEVGEKLQAAKNYGIAADVDREMRQTSADFQASRAGRTDEDNWSQEWKDKSEEVWAKINDQHQLPPQLRRQLTNNFKDWQQATGIEIRTMANRQAINRATDRVGLAADEAAKDGDEHGINVAFDGAVANHLMLPEVAQKLKTDYLRKIDEYAGKNFIMNNPAGAVDFIEAEDKSGKPVNLTRLTPDQRLTLLNAARVQFTKYQTENYSDLIEGLQNGQVKDPTELQALVASNVISPKQRKSYETAYRHGKFNTSVDEIGGLFTEINNYDPQKDPDFHGRAKLMARIATSGYPQNVQSDMNQLIGLKSDPKSVLNSPVAKDAFEGIDQRFKLGLFGKYESKVEDKDGNIRTTVNKDVYEKAMTVKRRVEDATRKFVEENPKATAEDVNRFVSVVQAKSVDQGGVKTLLGALGQGLPVIKETADEQLAQLDAILKKAKKNK